MKTPIAEERKAQKFPLVANVDGLVDRNMPCSNKILKDFILNSDIFA
jgi:hypothetical protein